MASLISPIYPAGNSITLKFENTALISYTCDSKKSSGFI